MCDVLKEVYTEIYDEDFNYGDLDHRIKLQKAVYILENMGIDVGEYSFSWNKYGPYSLALDCDAQRLEKKKEQVVEFSDVAMQAFEKIRGFLAENEGYTARYWMECIVSLHYLKFIMRINDKQLIKELMERKKYLNNLMLNERAKAIIEKINVG